MPNLWEKFYQTTPLDRIPWNNTQQDYLSELIESGKLGTGTALDVGCGVGMKSIQLAQHGFETIGVDISKTAIRHAKENANKAKANAKFMVADATNLSRFKTQKFDLILDWANLHGIPTEKVKKYVGELAKHSKRGGHLILRCFNREGMSPMEIGFITHMGPVYAYSLEEVQKLYGKYLAILERRTSKSIPPLQRWFNEYLMIRK